MMKRLIILLLVIVLLAGCSSKKKQTKEPPTEPTNGWYEQGSVMETQTGGAVRVYQVQTGTVTELAMIGSNVILLEQGEKTNITVMEPVEGTVLAQMELEEGGSGLQVIYNALAYYLDETKEIVFLEQSLQETNRIKLPDEAEGIPVVALDSSEIYYCVGSEIKAYDTTLNISRPVRNHTCKSQTLVAAHFGGAVLECKLFLEDGSESIAYVSAKTGELLSKDQNILSLSSNQSNYIALRMDGVVRQQIVGTLGGTPTNLIVSKDVIICPAVNAGGLVTYRENAQGSLDVELYDASSGTKCAAISLPGVGMISAACADANGLWLLADMQEGQVLYYWTFSMSPVQEETVYTTTLYTAENPDKAGLDACEDRADDIASGHYISIRVWDDATYTPDGYTIIGEYQTEAINAVLDELETALSAYPDRFLYRCAGGTLRINIVRSISGNLASLQFRRGSDPYIVLTAGCNVAEEFHKSMGFIINNRVLAKSPLFDNWADLNPEGFVYGETTDESYLSGEKQAFADADSMKSVTDDRSLIFGYAMKSDNAAMFQSPIMQAKLRQLCLGIRDTWSWEDKTDIFPWEQYLNEPLAPQS